MAVVNITPAFLANKLTCPPGKKKIEFCDSAVPGLLIEARSAAASVPTWFWRYKDSGGKTRLRRLGSLNELALSDARRCEFDGMAR